MVSAGEIVALQDRLTGLWHETANGQVSPAPVNSADAWLDLVARQHRANFDLWHIEDEARRPEASDAELAAVKRRIDQTNQLRNDLAEELDRKVLGARIQAALGKLTPRERMVFELKHYQGLRLRTIGEMLNTTEETAKNTLFRATKKLRAQLAELR